VGMWWGWVFFYSAIGTLTRGCRRKG